MSFLHLFLEVFIPNPNPSTSLFPTYYFLLLTVLFFLYFQPIRRSVNSSLRPAHFQDGFGVLLGPLGVSSIYFLWAIFFWCFIFYIRHRGKNQKEPSGDSSNLTNVWLEDNCYPSSPIRFSASRDLAVSHLLTLNNNK